MTDHNIISAEQWPEDAHAIVWDSDGQSLELHLFGSDWGLVYTHPNIDMPPDHDWRVPVLRPVTLAGSVPKPVAVIPTGHPTSVVQWLGPMPPQGTYLYTAPQQSPASDLEQFRVAVEAYEFEGKCKQLEYCFGPDADKLAAEAQMADAKRLLALIDVQANVRSSSEHSEPAPKGEGVTDGR